MSILALKAVLSTCLFIFGILEFLHEYSQVLVYTGGVVALLTLLFMFYNTTFYTRVISVTLCAVGLTALFSGGMDNWQQGVRVVEGFGEMASIIALAVAVTFLGLPLRLGKYAEMFQGLYSKSKTLYRPYIVSVLTSYFLSFLAILGSVAPSFHLVEQNLDKMGIKLSTKFVSLGIMRAYVMAILISPVAAINGIARNYSGLSWAELFLPAFLLSFSGIIAAVALEYPKLRQYGENIYIPSSSGSNRNSNESGYGSGIKNYPAPEQSGENTTAIYGPKKVFTFILLFVCVLGAISLSGNVLNLTPINSISVGCVAAVFIWGVLTGYFKVVALHIAGFFKNDIVKLSEQIVLFIAAGFFTYSIEQSGWLGWIGYFLEESAESFGQVLVLSLVPVVIVLLSITGLHPLASGIVIARAFTASQYIFDPLGVAISLMSGMSVAFIISPFSALILMMSSLTGQSPYRLSLTWNFAFAIVFLSISIVFMSVFLDMF